MVTQQKQEFEKIGATHPVPNHVHDLVHGLSHRIDGVWRYDQYIKNAEGMPDIQDCWRQIKQQDEQNIQKLKDLLARNLLSGDAGQQPGGRMGQMTGAQGSTQAGSTPGRAGMPGAGDRPI